MAKEVVDELESVDVNAVETRVLPPCKSHLPVIFELEAHRTHTSRYGIHKGEPSAVSVEEAEHDAQKPQKACAQDKEHVDSPVHKGKFLYAKAASAHHERTKIVFRYGHKNGAVGPSVLRGKGKARSLASAFLYTPCHALLFHLLGYGFEVS